MFLKHGFRFLKQSVYWAYRLILGLVVVFGIAWVMAVVALHFFVLPKIDQYSEPILGSVSQAIGQTVEIGRIEAGWRDLRPALNFFDVRVVERGGLQTLALDKVDTVLSWQTLIAGKIVFELIEFSGSNVEVRRDSIGTVWVAGKALERRAPGARSRLLNWLLAQEQIVVTGAQVTWIDEMRAAPVLLIDDVRLRIENNGKRHRFGLTGRPPAELASEINANGSFFGDDFEYFLGQGRIYTEFEYANLAYLQTWLALPAQLESGLGDLRLWMDIDERMVRRVVAEGNLVNVSGRFGSEVDAFVLASLSGRVQWEEDEAAKMIAVSNLTLETADGVKLAPANISLTTPRAAQSRTQLRVRALELGPLNGLTRFLPLSPEDRETLAAFQPGGVIEEMGASWLKGADSIQALQLNGRFRKLGIKPVGAMPGFSGMSGTVSVNEGGGAIALKTENAALDYPQMFVELIPLDYVEGDVHWKAQGKEVRVTVDSLSFTNEHAAGEISGGYVYPGAGLGEIEARAKLVRAEARDVWRYFPHAIAATRDWLKQGLGSGTSDNVTLNLKGPLDKFPFANRNDGIFEITASVDDATVRIGEDWPLIEGIDGIFRVDGDRIDIKPRSGTIMGADVSQTVVSIPNLGTRKSRLAVTGRAKGETEQYLQFVANSPIARYTKGATAEMRGQGTGTLQLQLDLPFFDLDATTVSGAIDIEGPWFRVSQQAPQLSKYAMRVEFDRDRVILSDGRAQLLGGPARFASVASREGTSAVRLSGVAEARDLAAFVDLPVLGYLDGRAEWRGTLIFDKPGSHLSIESPLVGVGSRLPAPLNKLESVALPIRFDMWTKNPAWKEYALALDTIGSARLTTREGKLERADIAFRGKAKVPQQDGAVVTGTVNSLDYDAWRTVLSDAGRQQSPVTVAMLSSIDLDIGTLRFADRTFNDLRITGKRIKNNLQLDLVGPQVKGGMLLASSERGDESINARFEFLKLAPDQPSISTPVAAESGEHRKRIPAALNVIVESFEFEGKSLGRLELLAAPEKTGWRLERLAIANPDGRIDVRGNWSVTGRPHAEYAVRFEASDTGKFLARLGYAEAVVGGTASLTGPVSWLGGPFKPDLPTLTGKLKLEVAVGRFAQVDPGAGQLIGLLSLQALPRRITLNFNDVFSSGFSFDRIEADVVVTEGLAQTDNFRMEGPAAEVTMRGEVNLVTETQNVDVRVKPMLSTAAAVAGAAVINPLVGVATLLVQKALGDPVEEAASRYYRVTGTWGDPQIERIKRPASQDKASAAGR